MWFLVNVGLELGIYLIIDNITKFFILNNRRENRFDILIFECLLLGFLIGFLSFYYQTTYLLIVLLFIHILGTLYTEHRLNLIVECGRILLTYLFNSIFSRRSPNSNVRIDSKKLPEKYLYNYRLTPSQHLSAIRPGISNLHGTTCSLNALMQSLASLNQFCSTLQRNINFSRFAYDSIVSAFVNILAQLRNDHENSSRLIDTAPFISRLNTIDPHLISKTQPIDIAELCQKIFEILNNAIAKQVSICPMNVLEQVQNRKLTTFSLNYLNKIFLETESQLHNRINLDNLDAQASYIVQYVDLTWLLHHIQLGSIVKSTFSGQILHAHCCTNCSHVRFRTEPFQILPLTIGRTDTQFTRLISQLTNIDIIDSMLCSYCSSQISDEINSPQQETIFTKLSSTLSPLLTTRLQPSEDSSFPKLSTLETNQNIPLTTNSNRSKTKSQIMIANYPNVLCIQLKRFSYDRLSQTGTKLTTKISIESEKLLDLSHLHYSRWLGLTQTIPSTYRLVAVCLHLSKVNRTNSNEGHYVCLYRNEHNRWYLTDDERVTEINQNENIFQTSFVTENCYLLFYERCL